MKICLTVLIAFGIVFGIKPAFSFPFNNYKSIRIDCPQSANIAAVDVDDWSGESSFVTVSLADVSVSDHLYCMYEGCIQGVNFNLSQKVPEDYPNCFEREDRGGFICRNYRISRPIPRKPPYYPYPLPYPYR